jgi:hypothetical protein
VVLVVGDSVTLSVRLLVFSGRVQPVGLALMTALQAVLAVVGLALSVSTLQALQVVTVGPVWHHQ